ncbi:MAG: PAS domain S-box protein [Desulfuromonadales bacterium]|nr:MAG: PAS domain S-box protein [Desulfuromonadales bacterium]
MRTSPSLKRSLVASFILTAVIPFLAIGFISLYFLRKDLMDSITTSNLALACSVANEVDVRLADPLNLMEHVAEMMVGRIVSSPGTFDDHLDSEMKVYGHFESLFVLDAGGRVVHAALQKGERARREDYLGMDMSTLPVYQEARKSNALRWSRTFVSMSSGEPTITAAFPFRGGTVLGNLNLRGLGKISRRAGLGTEGAVIIVDKRGMVIAHPDQSHVAQQLNMAGLEVVRRGLKGESGTYRYTNNGVEKFGSVVTIERTGWLVIVEQDVARAFAPVYRVQWILLAGMGVTVILALAAGIVSLGRMLRPLASLVRSAKKMAGGNYSFDSPPPSYRELDELSANFSAMAHAVCAREEELRDRNEELAMTEEELRQQIEESHRNQDELSVMNYTLQTIFGASPLAMVTLDLAGNVTMWNGAAGRIFGWSAEEVLSRPYPIHAEGEARGKLITEVLRTDRAITAFEFACRRQDGTPIHVSLSAAPLQDARGNPAGIITISADVTERWLAGEKIRNLNADLERMVHERTIQLETANSELESFSYSVSHDLRAPLRHINGFSLALTEEYADVITGPGQEYLHRIGAAANRMGELIDDLLELSRVSRGPIYREPVNLSRMARSLVDELVESQPDRHVVVDIADDIIVDGDLGLLRVALANLIGNAWKYTGRKDEAHIRVDVTETKGERVIFVQDDGAGFDMRYVHKLFGPFQRLHAATEFEGTGIGLATVQRIVQRHGGRVWADAEVDRGATFYFTLP